MSLIVKNEDTEEKKNSRKEVYEMIGRSGVSDHTQPPTLTKTPMGHVPVTNYMCSWLFSPLLLSRTLSLFQSPPPSNSL